MTNKTNLPATQSSLHGTGLTAGTLMDQAFANLNQEQADLIRLKAADAALELEKLRRTQDLNRNASQQAIDDHIDAFDHLDKSDHLKRHIVSSEMKTGAGHMRIQSKSGATCFVATAAYGNPDHPDVVFLRAFRDQILAQTPTGQLFISWYWRTGPKLARVVDAVPISRMPARHAIGVVAAILKRRYSARLALPTIHRFRDPPEHRGRWRLTKSGRHNSAGRPDSGHRE